MYTLWTTNREYLQKQNFVQQVRKGKTYFYIQRNFWKNV